MEHQEGAVTNPQVIYTWDAPLRAYRKKSKGVMRFYIALALLLSILILLIGDRILVLPVWASLFIFYVLTVTPPPIINYTITRFGLMVGKDIYQWEDLAFFYVTKKLDYYSIAVVTHRIYPSTLYFTVTSAEQKKRVIEILSEHLVFQEHSSTSGTDKILQFFSNLMPQEEDPAGSSKDVEESPEPQTPSPIFSHPHQTSQSIHSNSSQE